MSHYWQSVTELRRRQQSMKILPMKISPLKSGACISDCRLIWLLSMIPVHGDFLMKIPPMKFSGLVRNHLDKPHRHLLADFCVTGAKIPGMIFSPMKFSWVRGPYATSWMKFSCMKIFGAKISFHPWKFHFHPWKFHAHDFFMHETFRTGTLLQMFCEVILNSKVIVKDI